MLFCRTEFGRVTFEDRSAEALRVAGRDCYAKEQEMRPLSAWLLDGTEPLSWKSK